MTTHSKSIALIPARGGSKRIPNKNIVNFLGKPLIAYSIQTAQKSRCFDEIIVSTNCENIAKVAQEWGAKVPFIRPKELSDDFTPTLEVITHAIKALELKDEDRLCCIYPTAPLLQEKTIKEAFRVLKNSYVFCACEFDFTPFRSFSFENQTLQMLYPEHQNTRSQDLPSIYHDAGMFYLGYVKTFREKKPIFSPSSTPIILPRSQTQDIDTPQDLLLAELKYKAMYES